MKKNLAKKVTLSILAGAVLMSSSVVWAAVTTPPNFDDDDDWACDEVNIWHTFRDEIQLNTGTDKNFTSAYSSTGVATGGKVTISDGTFTGNIYGGYAVGLSDGGEASDNTVTINGGMFTGNICGGYVMTMPERPVNATKNTVTISGTANLENAELFGGAAPMYPPSLVGGRPNSNVPIIGIESDYGGETTPNTLNINQWIATDDGTSNGTKIQNKVKSIQGFDKIHFEYIDWEKDGTVVEVTDSLSLASKDSTGGTAVTVGTVNVKTGGITANDKMHLLKLTKNGATITGDLNKNGSSKEVTVNINEGVAKTYTGVDCDIEETNTTIDLIIKDTLSVVQNGNQGTTPGNPKPEDKPTEDSEDKPTASRNDQVLVLGESRAAATAFTNQGSELIETGLNALARDNEKDTKVFAAVYGNHSEYETGSHVNVNGWSGIVGIGKTNADGLTVGAFFENGEGNYSTHNIFTNDYIRGDGEACYNGGGFLVRKDNANGVYTEASLRAGNLQNELRNAVRNGSELTGYDIDTFYYGAHVGVGKVIARGNDGDSVDVYGKFIYTHHDGETFDIGGTATKFDSVESERLRLGFRINEVQTNKLSMYYGAAWEYEFNGDAHDKIASFDLETPSLEGSTVIGEIGAHYKASEKWSIDLNGRAYVGQREGFSGSVQANYAF